MWFSRCFCACEGLRMPYDCRTHLVGTILLHYDAVLCFVHLLRRRLLIDIYEKPLIGGPPRGVIS